VRVAIATYAEEGAFLRARLRAVTDGRRLLGEWTPFATASLEKGDGARGILIWAVVGGLVGALGLFALESWSAVWAYDFNEGGRPLWSWQAFVPPPVEFGALCAAIAGLVRLFVNASLTRLHHAAFDFEEVLQASQGRFVLALGCDAGEDANAALAILAEAGAEHSRLVEP
jgi:hypothetical protein